MTRKPTATTTTTAAATAGTAAAQRGVGVGVGVGVKIGRLSKGSAARKNSGNNTKRNDTGKQHQPRQILLRNEQKKKKKKTEVKKMNNDDEEFPSLQLQLQLQSAVDFPSLTAGTSSGADSSSTSAQRPQPSTATGGNKSVLSRGWEAKTAAVPFATASASASASAAPASASAGKATTRTSGAGTSKTNKANKSKQEAKGGKVANDNNHSKKKQQQQQQQQLQQKSTDAAADANKTNKKKKNKKKKDKSKIPTDPRLAAAFQPLPAARTDEAHAAHMIPFPLSAAGSKDGGGALLMPKHKHRRAAVGFAHVDPTGMAVGMMANKGRQRLGPRKKRLSTLKKKVLQERLKVWKERNGIVEDGGGNGGGATAANGTTTASTSSTTPYHTVCLRNFVTDEQELVDDDEYDEIVSDLRNLATKIGPVDKVYVPRPTIEEDNGWDDENEETTTPSSSVVGLAFVRYQNEADARAAIASFDALTVGGSKIEPTAVVEDGTADGARGDDWRLLMHRYSPSADADADAVASEANAPGSGEGTAGDTVIVILENILSEDDFDDEDCLAESTDDIRALAEQFGTVVKLTPHIDGEQKGQVHVTYQGDAASDQNAASKLNGMVIGGSSISARVLNDDTASTGNSDPNPPVLILENMLTEDDLEDEDCLQESVEDILKMCKEIGEVASIQAHTEGDQKGQVHVTYTGDEGADNAKAAVAAFNGRVVGGETISARLDMPPSSDEAAPPVLILRNLLTEDDYDDEDVLEETKADAMEMLQQYGDVKEMKVHVDGVQKGEIHVIYAGGSEITTKAQAGIHGIVRGGETIEAEIFAPDNATANNMRATNNASDDAEKPKPMLSGDKVIPERYAECKRAPKVPNKGIPRAYATKIDDDNVVPLINEMLGELMRLQLRSKDDKNARARRRLVMGLREVARGIKSHKVKMVIMADNLDEYGAIDEKLQEILDLAEKEDVPVFFELSKRRLGKALGKSIKVAVVGIYSADGAYQQFKQLQKIYLRAPRKAPPASKD